MLFENQVLNTPITTTGMSYADFTRALFNVKLPKLVDGIDIPDIVDYEVYNHRVVKITFADGTFTKCVADSSDDFDFYTGVSFCLFKKMLGDDGHRQFNRIMRAAMKALDTIDDCKQEEAREEMRLAERRRKAQMKRTLKKAMEREEKISIQVEAMRRFANNVKG